MLLLALYVITWDPLLSEAVCLRPSNLFECVYCNKLQRRWLINRYLEKKIERKDYRRTVLLRCMYCCLHCCEICTTYLSKNAYILVINRGYGLLKAGKRSFQLLAANLAIVSSLKIVYTLFIWLEKLAICFGYH